MKNQDTLKSNEELRHLSVDELNDELMSLRKQQFNLRLKKATGALQKTHVVRGVRRAIARIKTIMTEKAGQSHVNK